MKQSDTSNLFKSMIAQKATANRKDQTQTLWHWILLILFAMLTYASMFQQILLIVLLIGVTAVVKGPLMLLWGSIYSALVAFFPPITMLLSILFFVLNIGAAAKNWRITLVGFFFYLYPLLARLSQSLLDINSRWITLLLLTIGITGFHFLLKWLYQQYFTSHSLMVTIVSMPHTLFVLFLPSKIPGLKKTRKTNY
ncbi:hypothetical protein LI951_08375 [Enterococcus sp. BWT-B8]|uniref:hypothetical protein n=1 Tax=Enterococcus sp. BWT-B8 TaxID=2885157 RepID=UPI001E6417A0|nr:hypothetical protein [Enterococcus sp. BWT-B8]MCB5952078.1 hypothetical protein [Enterococcus sp. BWT-B8]